MTSSNDPIAMGVLRACMSVYLDIQVKNSRMPLRGATTRGVWEMGASDMLTHQAMLVLGVDRDQAAEWLGEELAEMLADRD